MTCQTNQWKENRMDPKLANVTGLYLEGIRDGNVRESVERYTGDRYTQHSTGVADGVEGFVSIFEPFVKRNPGRDIRLVRSIVDGNHVFIHAYQDINNGETKWVTTDLFDTDDNDKIVEHWDVIAAYSDEPSVNGHTQVDGPTEIVDVHLTEDNKALVALFGDDVLVNHWTEKIKNYVGEEYWDNMEPYARRSPAQQRQVLAEESEKTTSASTLRAVWSFLIEPVDSGSPSACIGCRRTAPAPRRGEEQ